MSDTTEMMLDGTLCRECGSYRGPEPGESGWETWDPEGYPCLCADCAKRPQKKKANRKVALCGWYR